MNFEQSGRVTTCCMNRDHALGSYPENSISDMWNGDSMVALRSELENNSLKLGCDECAFKLTNEIFDGVYISNFDAFVFDEHGQETDPTRLRSMPTVFEFELDNTCNLECIMCGGQWSSAIRKNREKLPRLHTPYDEGFVEQLRTFIPHLRRCNFLGGEPFLIQIYYSIWKVIEELNPKMKVFITSNGTTLPSRAREIINNLANLKVILSIDSLQKKTYESIRLNADFDKVMENMDYLVSINRLESLTVCPMIQNRFEIPDILRYCQDRNIAVNLNTVYTPLGGYIAGIHQTAAGNDDQLMPYTALRHLSIDDLGETIAFYDEQSFNRREYGETLNKLRSELHTWYTQKKQHLEFVSTFESKHGKAFSDHVAELKAKLDQRLDDCADKEEIIGSLEKVEEFIKTDGRFLFDFYAMLSYSDIDVVIENCRKYDAVELFEMFKSNM